MARGTAAANIAAEYTGDSNIAHQATVYYDRVAMDNLKKALRFNSLTEARKLPKQSGLVTQLFRYIPFSANTTAAASSTEGAVGTPINFTSQTTSATIGQYFDFINYSDLLLDTIIDDTMANVAEEMGYRAGLSVDTLIRNAFDAGSASTSVTTIGSNLGSNDFRKAVMTLRGLDVQPKEGGDFLSLGHPYVLYDLISESSTGGFIDVTKYTVPNADVAFRSDELGKISGVRLGQSTNVSATGAGATTARFVYVVGKGAVASVNLGEGAVGSDRNPQVKVLKFNADKSDPAGVIGGAISYNFKFAAKSLYTSSDQYRYKIICADSSIAS